MKTLTRIAPIAPIAALVCSAASFAAEAPVMRPLFNGKDLSGWIGGGYIVEDGAIVWRIEAKKHLRRIGRQVIALTKPGHHPLQH